MPVRQQRKIPWRYIEERIVVERYRMFERGEFENEADFLHRTAATLGRSPHAIRQKLAHLKRLGAIRKTKEGLS